MTFSIRKLLQEQEIAMGFFNVYADSKRAEAYSKLEFPGTYYLAYRDLPEIIFQHVKGRRAIDFGCGAGRSTRFLQKLGFDVIGVDISEDMIKKRENWIAKGIIGLSKMTTLVSSKARLMILCYLFLRLTIYLRWKTRSEYSKNLDAY